MSINPKSLKEILKLKFDDFFYYFQNDKPYKVSTKKITDYITDNVLGVLPPILDKHSQITLDDGTNPHGTTKSDVGLSDVDNTSDANKPISSATALEFVNVYNEVFTKANNYVDIASIISGYTLTATDAGKLITNSGVNVRSLNIPSGLALPNNVVFVKGRVSITPASGVVVELPDGTTITNSAQFTCLANTQYVLHRKEFGGDEWILLALGSAKNLGNSDLEITDATRTVEMGTGSRILKFLSNTVEKIIFNTASGSPTLQANKSGNGAAIRANKTSGTGSALEIAGGTTDFGNNKGINLADPTNPQDAVTLAYYTANMYGGKRYTLIKPNGTKEFYDTLTQVRSNWADGDVLHQFADETDITYVDNGSGYMFTLPNLHWIGNGFSVKVSNILVSGEAYFLPIGKTAYLSNVKLGGQGANVSSVALINGTLYCDDNTFISIDIENNKSSSLCLNLAGTMYGGNVIANGDGEAATLPQVGIGGAGTCINVNTRGFQSGSLTNFFGGSTTYSVATNYRNVYCNFGNQQIGNGKTFDHCYIYSTRNNNGANQSVFVARNCTIIHVPSANTHTFYNIANITMIDCVFISAGYLCASFGSAGPNLIQGGYHSFANQTNYGAHNYSSLLTIIDCTIEATNASATTDVLLLNNSNATNVKINNVTFKNSSGRSDIRTIPANNVEWKNCRFSKGSAHISVSSGTVADAINNNPARLTDPTGFLNNTGNGNWFMYVPMTTAERDALTSVSAGFVIRNTTTNFLQVYNGSIWKDLLDLT